MRPTSDRVREAIFDILGEGVAGVSVLDLFAGSGALGLEALSRGATRGVFVEAEPDAFACLRKNIDALGAGEAEALLLDYRQALRRLRARSMRFDLVFLDPPYGKGMAGASAAGLSRAGLVQEGGTVVVEEAVRAPEAAFPAEWTLADDRRYGDTRVMLFRAAS